jgi:hypothetical protein
MASAITGFQMPSSQNEAQTVVAVPSSNLLFLGLG